MDIEVIGTDLLKKDQEIRSANSMKNLSFSLSKQIGVSS